MFIVVLLAEELLLLCLDPATGRRSARRAALDPGLAGALIAELVLAERVGVDPGTTSRWRAARITVLSETPTDDAELDRALAAIARKEGRRVKDLVSRMSGHRLNKGLQDRLLARLAGATVVMEQQDYVLGLVPRTVWLLRDASRLRPLQERLAAALVDGETPAERTTALIGLLYAMGHVAKVVPNADRRAVRRRAGELSHGDWVAGAVKQAIQDESGAAAGG